MAAISWLPLRSLTVWPLIVAGSIFSLKVAVTGVFVAAVVESCAGETEVTDGGVTSGPALLLKTTSTQ